MSGKTGSIAGLLLLVCVAADAGASSGGISGLSGNPANGGDICNICHSGGTVPTVTITGPLTVQAGSTSRYQLVISGGQQVAGGLDVSVDGGSLSAIDAGTYILNGEVTHTTPRDAVGFPFPAVTFEFDWTAPLSAGTVHMYGAGNSVDLASATNGDAAAADELQIVVEGATATPGESSGPDLSPLLVTGFDVSTGDISLSYETACGASDNSIHYGPLDQVATHGWTGSECAIGSGGTYGAFHPGSGSYFFVVVGHDGSVEGSYGKGPAPLERPDYPGSVCGRIQDLGNTCVQP
jgi:hypothetical protein